MSLVKLMAAYLTPNQLAVIDSLMKESGILATMPFYPASHGMVHKSKRKTALPTASWRRPGGSIVPQTTADNITDFQIFPLSDIAEEDVAICNSYPGGVGQYFNDELAAYMESLGQSAGKQLVYGTDATFGGTEGFKGLRQYAVEAGNEIQAGGTSASRTTILAVRWKRDVCCGLYPTPLGRNVVNFSDLLKVTPLSGGKPVTSVVNTTTGAVKPVYQVLLEAYLGLMVNSSVNVAAYTQIQDATDKKPTSVKLDELVDMVHGTANDTFIYCNRLGRRLIWALKDSKMTTTAAQGDYSTAIERWNGIPVVLEENISSVETI